MLFKRHVHARAWGTALLLALLPAVAAGQQSVLTLDEALELARRNNPDYLASTNDIDVSDALVKEALGLLLPGADVSSSLSYQAAGEQRVGLASGSELGINSSTDYYYSTYDLGLSYRINGAALYGLGREKTARAATAANIEASGFALDAEVTRRYLGVIAAQDGVTLARQELTRAEENVRLAEARVAVGAAIPLEAQQAQVERGRAQVTLLQTENLVRTERLRLMQLLGVELDPAVELTTQFTVNDIPWTQQQLVSMATEGNPVLRAARARERVADASVRMARASYFPSLSISAGWSGFARQAGNDALLVEQARQGVLSDRQSCELLNRISAGLSQPLPNTPADCSMFVLTPDQEARIRDRNDVFPFGFERDPFGASVMISMPIFQNFSRNRQVEQARVARSDAEQAVRSEELRVRAEVGTAYFNLVTARQSEQLEARNRQLASDQLELERERYRVGAASYIELQEAETLKARADRAYLNALYSFHESLAALETAVGRPLRTGDTN